MEHNTLMTEMMTDCQNMESDLVNHENEKRPFFSNQGMVAQK